MQVDLMYNHSENNVVNKRLDVLTQVNALLKTNNDIVNPVLELKLNESVMNQTNYIHIPDFNRFYFIVGKPILIGDRYIIQCHTDVLETFSSDVLSLQIVADKTALQSKSDMFIDDGSFVTENRLVNQIYNFPNGFNDNGEFILITVGG